ncbi:hypothetical protein HK102_003198, partial [Quaeritorhiza haematococci]
MAFTVKQTLVSILAIGLTSHLQLASFVREATAHPQPQNPIMLPDFEPDAQYLQQTLSIDRIDADQDPCLIREKCLSGPGMRTILR